MPAKRTLEEFKDLVFKLVKDEYSVISNEYINTNTKLKMKHNICGFEYETTPANFLGCSNRKGRRCPNCFKNEYSKKEVEERLKNLIGNDYHLVSDYKSGCQKVKIFHDKCQKIFEVRLSTMFNLKTHCPICSGHILTDELIDERLKKQSLDVEYERVEPYISGRNSKITMKHKLCGNTFKVASNNFFGRGTRCPKCSHGSILKTLEEFKKEVKEIDPEFEFIGPYSGCMVKSEFKHIVCGKTFFKRPNSFLNGEGCPHCRTSKNERKIKKILNEQDEIKFEVQYQYKNKLPNKKFDFLLIYKEKDILLEYDGQFHYHILKNTTEQDLLNQQIRDKEKTDFCKLNNISLIRIPYWYSDYVDLIIKNLIEYIKLEKYLPIMDIVPLNSKNDFLEKIIRKEWD